MSNNGMPTPVGTLDTNLTQLDWAKRPLTYRFEIVAMDAVTMNLVLDAISWFDDIPSMNPAANLVARVDLAINPQRYVVDETTRQTVTQTVAGAWVDAYGLGLPKISMSGTTGWNPRGARKPAGILSALGNIGNAVSNFSKVPAPTGLQDFILLRNNIFRLYAVLLQQLNIGSNKRVQDVLQLRFYAWDTEDFFIVLIDDFKLNRNATRPMMYDYDLQMTVIGYPDKRPSVQDALTAYYGPIGRLQGILNSINNFISTIQAVEAAVQNFDETLAAQIGAVTSDITALATAAQAVVSGAESFINMPFSIVNTITSNLRTIANSIVAVEQLPQDFINNVRAQALETCCGLYGLATYPALFKQSASASFGNAPWGNSGCSSTMGVPPSPISPLAGVSIPGSLPSPSQLPTDVTLATVPLALSGQGSTSKPTAAFRPKQVSIKDGDTIESIIKKSGGLNANVASVWQQIATMNGLEYPYIAPNSEFKTQIFAIGTVTFYGTAGSTVPTGTRVAYTPPSGGPIFFRTISSVTLASNGQGSVGVIAEAAGALANVGPLSISQILDSLGNPLTISGVSSVSNTSETIGGKIWQVLRPGDKILLPVLANSGVQEPYLDRTADNNQNLFGNDIMLDETGDFVSDAGGDLRAVQGLANMETAIINRLQTEPTELIKHSDYGLNLVRLVGEPGDANAATLMKLEIKACLLQDPRVKGVSNVKVLIKNQQMLVSANVTLIDEKTVPMSASFPI